MPLCVTEAAYPWRPEFHTVAVQVPVAKLGRLVTASIVHSIIGACHVT